MSTLRKSFLSVVSINDDLTTPQVLSVVQSAVAIKAVSAGLGVLPEDLSNSAQKHTEKVRNLA